MACKFNQLQVSICSKMTIGDYQFYHADALMEDFDNDGDVDILVADRREADGMWGILRNMLFLGDGRGGFKPVATQISGIDRNSIAMEAADLNDDGLLDVVLLNSPFNSYPPNLPMVPPLPADRRLNSVYWNTGAHGEGQPLAAAEVRGRRSRGADRGPGRTAAGRQPARQPPVAHGPVL